MLDGMIVREMARRCMYDPERIIKIRKLCSEPVWAGGTCDGLPDDRMVLTLWSHYRQSGYLSARILDHLTGDNIGHVDQLVIMKLIESLPAKPFKILTIHDCFRCLPSYGNDLRKQYALQLHLIAKSDLLNFILSQILKRKVNRNKLDLTLANDILETDYALS